MRGIQVDATRFRQIRQARGFTQRQLAKLAGVGERTVRNAESGQRIRLDFLNYLATALGIEIVDIVHDPDELRTALGEQRKVDHILTALQAQTEGDFSELFNLLSQNALLNSPGPADIPTAGEFRGTDGIQTFFDRSSAAIGYEEPPQINDIRTGGNLVVISGFNRLRAIPTNKSFSIPWLQVFEFDKGHIVRIDNWGDVAEIQKAFLPG